MLSERDLSQIESRTQELGREIFSRIAGQKPSIFRESWWSGRVMDWSMRNENFKVEMFRFVDVLPSLHSSEEIARHIQEYFCRPEENFPKFFQWGLRYLSPKSFAAKALARILESNVRRLARRFMAGSHPQDALLPLKENWKRGITFTADLLGEATLSEKEAAIYQRRYLELLDFLEKEVCRWKTPLGWESAFQGGEYPLNVSVKLSALYSQLDPINLERSVEGVCEKLRPILEKAKEARALLNLDMEQFEWKNMFLAVFKKVLEEEGEGRRDERFLGIAIQAYLKGSERDVEELLSWGESLGQSFSVRLVKGAYWEFETTVAKQKGKESPVWERKRESDACYERITRTLLESYPKVHAAFGSHNVRSVAYAIATAEKLGVPADGFEIQMLYGMAEPVKKTLVEMGYRVRDYAPIGELLPGIAYLVRRLLENTSNESFLRQKFVEKVKPEDLLKSPHPLLRNEESPVNGNQEERKYD